MPWAMGNGHEPSEPIVCKVNMGYIKIKCYDWLTSSQTDGVFILADSLSHYPSLCKLFCHNWAVYFVSMRSIYKYTSTTFEAGNVERAPTLNTFKHFDSIQLYLSALQQAFNVNIVDEIVYIVNRKFELVLNDFDRC